MATLSHTKWLFVCPKAAGDLQGVVWIQSFPLIELLLMINTASRLAAAMPGSLVRGCLWVNRS